MDQAKQGAEALSGSKFSEAIDHYTKAIYENPRAVDYYVQRSTAYQRSSPPNNDKALQDAEVAVALAVKRGKRELIISSQNRRMIALFKLGRYKDSEHVFNIVKKMDKDNKSLAIWEKQIANKLANLNEDDGAAKLTIKDVPDVELPNEESKTEIKKPNVENSSTAPAVKPSAPEPPKPPQQTPADKIKHEWYQNSEYVYISLLAKAIPKDQATVDFNERSVSLSFPLQAGSTFDFSLEPLFASIDPSQSSYTIKSTKMEINLKKANPGVKWKELEGMMDADGNSEEPKSTIPQSILSGKTESPAYPTSSRGGPKNWDKVANELTARPKKDGEKGDSVDDDDDDEGDDVNKFFKQLYKGADPDTRRAMMKSYQESNGTALSTNWSEVSKGPVETAPPDGMEARKWGA